MNITLIDDAKTQFLKLWSVRFSLATSIFGAIQTGMALYDGKSIIVPAVTMVAGIAIAVARVIKQPSLKAEGGFEVGSSNGGV